MRVASPQTVIDYVRDAYQRYYDSAFWMRDEGIMAERRKLLQEPGVMAQEPLLEAVPVYPSVDSISDVCVRAKLGKFAAANLGDILFGSSDIKLRRHQAQALEYALVGDEQGRANVVVTSGTGSGKTESFLLPLIARLFEERGALGAGLDINRWWKAPLGASDTKWKGARQDLSGGFEPAVRALILYPTNALVEDQMGRLRQAAMRARKLAGRPLLYFGRYTSATLGGAYFPPARLKAPDRTKINQVSAELRKISTEAAELRTALEAQGKGEPAIIEAASQFPDPACGEMLTRWDIVSTPPDVLITNTSMLNIMLMREIEQPIFEQTRDWLARNKSNVFTLVVDELHSYRGTQGTEVALVVRNLLDRLGLAPDSTQVRFVATSASLAGEEGRQYLEQFFGVSRDSFVILPGEPRQFKMDLPVDAGLLEQVGEGLASEDLGIRTAAKDKVCGSFSPRIALAVACQVAGKGKDGTRPARLDSLRKVVLGDGASPKAMQALLTAAMLEDRGSWDEPKPTFRSHMFLRQVQGGWACSDPECSEVEEPYRSPGRKIGKLFKAPAMKCRCGGQVLELLYCYDCGEAFLGGFVVPHPSGPDQPEVFLESTKPGTAAVPPGMVFERPQSEFRWYWPGGAIPDGAASWNHQSSSGKGNKVFSFNLARLDPVLGTLQQAANVGDATGVLAADPANFRHWLRLHFDRQKVSWSKPSHSDSCDRSCPDCLRNYGNRFSHGMLDWRLALDLAQVALGEELDTSRWLGEVGERQVKMFAELCDTVGSPVKVEKHGGLLCVARNGKGLIFGHPLWHVAEGLLQPIQHQALSSFRNAHGISPEFVDIRDFGIRPATYILKLQS